MIAPYTDEYVDQNASMLSHISAGWDLSQLATLKIDEYEATSCFRMRMQNTSYIEMTTKVLQKMSLCMQLCYSSTLAEQFIILSVGNIAFC